MSDIPSWVSILLGLGTFVGAIVGALVILRKAGPEISRIQIESANNLVAMAETSAQMSKDVADDLRARNKVLDDRLTEMSRLVGVAQREIVELREKVGEIDVLRRALARHAEELRKVTAEKEQVASENEQLRDQVETLQGRVRHLETELRDLRSSNPGLQ